MNRKLAIKAIKRIIREQGAHMGIEELTQLGLFLLVLKTAKF